MIQQFSNLQKDEQLLLLRAPALVSVLASCGPDEINEKQRADAIKLAHLKTFTADAALIPYYSKVESGFEEQFDTLVRKYAPFDEVNTNRLKQEINRANLVIKKLEKNFGDLLYNSLVNYARHVKKSTHSVFEDFIFPLPLPGLND